MFVQLPVSKAVVAFEREIAAHGCNCSKGASPLPAAIDPLQRNITEGYYKTSEPSLQG